jgi:HemY protein
MIRVVLFLIAVCLIAYGFALLGDHPGDVSIVWLGQRVDTSVTVAVAAIATLVALAVCLWTLLRALIGSPAAMARAARRRRRRRGYEAISRGLVAIGAGDIRAAARFAAEAARIAPAEPLALLLAAQTAQLNGDRAGAEDAFRAMSERDDTRLLGLRGLYVEAQRRDDGAAARRFAEAAAAAAPAAPWASRAVLEFRCAAGDWQSALAILDENRHSGLLDKATYRRQRAVLLTARAMAAEDADRPKAKMLALEAVRLAPDLVPAAALAARLLADAGEMRKARRIIETAWHRQPHPDLADIYAHVRPSDSARERLARVEALARQAPGHVEAALAVARAALDAREFATARTALARFLDQPTQRIAMLMAELEELEHGDEGRAREWMARAVRAQRDAAWTADGVVAERWMPFSPVTGRLDAFEWKAPLAELPGPPHLIEEHEPQSESRNRDSDGRTPRSDTRPALDEKPAKPAADEQPAPAEGETSAPASAPPAPPSLPRSEERRAEPIIPLVPAPDDPGPEPEAEPGTGREPTGHSWRRWIPSFW